MKKTVYLLIGIFVGFFITGFAVAAPVSNVFTNVLPAVDETYDNGTSTQKWNNIYTKNITVSGTCTGCGAGTGGAFPFTPTTNFGQAANSTSTQIWFKGSPFSLTASSTSVFDYASTTALSVSNIIYGLASPFIINAPTQLRLQIAGGTQIFDFTQALFAPVLDGVTDLGTSSNTWKNIYTKYASTTAFSNSGTAYLGTVASGLWNGTAISETYGGTNQTSYTVGDILYASAANTLTKLSGNTETGQQFLSMTGDGANGAAPSWQPIPTAGDLLYFFYNTAADISTYLQQKQPVSPDAQEDLTTASVNNDDILQTFISASSTPGVTFIPEGEINVYLSARQSAGTAVSRVYAEIYKRSLPATETLLATTDNSQILTSSFASTTISAAIPDTVLLATDRIVTKIRADVTSIVVNPTIVLAIEGGSNARIAIPTEGADVSNFVPYTGAVKNLDLGTFNASSTQLTVSGNTYLTSITSALTLTGADGLIAEYAGTTCTNQFVRVLSALGAATCATVTSADVDSSIVPSTRTLTVAGTANQLTSSAGAQDLTANRTWTLSLPSHVIFPSSFTAALATTTNATSTNFTITGNAIIEPLTSALVLTGSGGALAEYTGTTCTNQFVRVLSALGAATCATVVATDVDLADLTATNGSLTFSGTYDGSTARTIGLNLGNANVWTALQTFNGNASSTQIGSTGNAYFATTGGRVGIGTTSPVATLSVQGNAYISGNISNVSSITATGTVDFSAATLKSHVYPAFTSPATTTTWTATSTWQLGSALTAETWNFIQCNTDASFLNVIITDGTNDMNLIKSSSTPSLFALTTNNTFTAGEKIFLRAGTTTTATATYISCRVDRTLN